MSIAEIPSRSTRDDRQDPRVHIGGEDPYPSALATVIPPVWLLLHTVTQSPHSSMSLLSTGKLFLLPHSLIMQRWHVNMTLYALPLAPVSLIRERRIVVPSGSEPNSQRWLCVRSFRKYRRNYRRSMRLFVPIANRTDFYHLITRLYDCANGLMTQWAQLSASHTISNQPILDPRSTLTARDTRTCCIRSFATEFAKLRPAEQDLEQL